MADVFVFGATWQNAATPTEEFPTEAKYQACSTQAEAVAQQGANPRASQGFVGPEHSAHKDRHPYPLYYTWEDLMTLSAVNMSYHTSVEPMLRRLDEYLADMQSEDAAVIDGYFAACP